MEKFEDKKIAIVGFGIEGQSVANFLLNTAPVSYTHLTLPTSDLV